MADPEVIQEYLDELSGGDANVRFGRLLTICESVFGEPRTKGSHFIFKTPWPGKPWINLQDDDGEAKFYQVR
ncbi:MAG: toxin HicA [Bradymonadaceae bacterium]